MSRLLQAIAVWLLSFGFMQLTAAQDADSDSSAGLPKDYAKNYLVAASTMSPDKKFAMQILYKGEYKATDDIPYEDISIQLVALPSKAVVAQLMDYGSAYEGITLLWSPDSKWCACYYHLTHGGYTTVFRLQGGKFIATNKEGELITRSWRTREWSLFIAANKSEDMARTQDIRSEYIRPLRWTKSGTLILWQRTITHDDTTDFELTAAYDGKKNKFRVVGARLLSPEEAEKLEAEAAKVQYAK